MVFAFPLAYTIYTLLTTPLPKMYEFATGHWLFKPEATDDISRDVAHLAQMTQRTGEEHDDVILNHCEVREKQHDLKGKETRSKPPTLLTFIPRHVETCDCGGC